jgi:ABC-type branched-subunit amino acid transport system ATPase component
MLKVESLHQAYGGSHILRGLSFEVKTGEVTTLLGRNGVGKTTLLKSLMGLVKTREGSMSFDGGTSPTCRPTSASRPASATCRRAARSSRASRWKRTC